MTDLVSPRPHTNRRRHQEALNRARRRRRKRRQARIHRIKLLRALRSARFWTRTLVGLVVVAAVVFWARYAFVYDIPDYARRGPVTHVGMYVTVKPWWFGPPIFDVQSFEPAANDVSDANTRYSILMDRMGRYGDILLKPTFVWTSGS